MISYLSMCLSGCKRYFCHVPQGDNANNICDQTSLKILKMASCGFFIVAGGSVGYLIVKGIPFKATEIVIVGTLVGVGGLSTWVIKKIEPDFFDQIRAGLRQIPRILISNKNIRAA